MKNSEAFKIICMVADGLNPYKEVDQLNEVPELNPITIRAICTAIASIVSKKSRDELVKVYSKNSSLQLSKSINGPLKEYLMKSLGVYRKELTYNYAMDNFDFTGTESIDEFLERTGEKVVLDALKTTESIEKAAERIGLSLRQMRYKLEKYNIYYRAVKDNIRLFGNKYSATETTNFIETHDIISIDNFLDDLEYQIISFSIKIAKWEKTKAAQLCGISLRSFRYRLEKHNIVVNYSLPV